MARSRKQTVGYVLALAGCFLLAMTAGWTTLGAQIDTDAYDFLFRLHPPDRVPPESRLLSIDEETLSRMGGQRRLRGILAEGLEKVAAAEPKAVVVDLILADEGDPEEDARLEAVFARTRNLVLACELVRDRWEEPLPRFRRAAAAVGHVYADPDRYDNVTRRIPLEKAAPRDRRWALALEAFRLSRGGAEILETPGSLQIRDVTIPAARSHSEARPLLIRFQPRRLEAGSSIPELSILQLRENPSLAETFRDKVVFAGVTAQSAADDRHMTPYSDGRPMPGVEIHASAFETLAQGNFLTPVPDSLVLLFCVALAAAAGVTFATRSGWQAYGIGVGLLAVGHLTPYLAFRWGSIFPYAAPVSTAWLSVVGAATYQHFVVRRQLRRSESERSRYQQAIHFVTHEMRTPLTAIQGSSEMMGRYSLGEEKSRQLAQMINSESKRLARMIQTFLDVERLSDGQMELKREPFPIAGVVESCLERVRPLAERKRIALKLEEISEGNLVGDRELMEYAVYNLLNNAVKYSPPETKVTVFESRDSDYLRLSVKDQGIGMDDKELRNIFQKFYRTRKAEASGETGTGIGLSIVEQIVSHHGGRIEVTSSPGKGSCFTMILPAPVSAWTTESS